MEALFKLVSSKEQVLELVDFVDQRFVWMVIFYLDCLSAYL